MTGTKRMLGRIVAIVVVALAGVTPRVTGQQATADLEPIVAQRFDFPLTIRNIMRGTELVGQAPSSVAWTDDSSWIYFRWRPGGGAWHESASLYRVPAMGGEPEVLTDAEAEEAAVLFATGSRSPDGRTTVKSVDGDLYIVEHSTMSVRRLTETTDSERSPSFSSDGRSVFFRRGDNIYSMGLDGGSARQLTDIRSGPAPSDDAESEGQRGVLEQQQEELFEHVRIERIREEERDESRERAEQRRLEPTYLAQGENVQALSINSSGTRVAVSVSRQASDSKGTIVPEWVTESGYTEDLNVRSKVGDAQPASRFGILDVATGETNWLTPWTSASEGDESASEPLASGAFRGWNDSGSHALLTLINFDYTDWKLVSIEGSTGTVTHIAAHHDSTWVGGPCFGFTGPCSGWIPGSDRAYVVSESSGWAHLYSVSADGSGRTALTEGEWEVRSVAVPQGADHFVLHTSESSAHNTATYRMDFDGGNRQRLTEGDGTFQSTESPDGSRLAIVHSRSNRPAELFVADNRRGAEMDQVTVSPTPEWLSFPWKEAEIIQFSAEDGTRVPARIYRPADVGAEANGAGVVFVHGAGYLQNVHNGWSGYFREFMFHHFLAAQGYTVLDIDYRGSAGYGSAWRTAVFRWMGGKDLSDQVDGARYLVDNEGVAPERLGIYGGSYGGFITLMALFTAPGTFEAGAALRSVTDWAHYNHWYTSRILNQPQDDEESYTRSSPIYFAEDFEGHLLMAHGMVDTNVHFSDVVRLSQRLIELGKEDWELAVYPVESHGFVEPTSWTDEYRRIYELFARTIGPGRVAGSGTR